MVPAYIFRVICPATRHPLPQQAGGRRRSMLSSSRLKNLWWLAVMWFALSAVCLPGCGQAPEAPALPQLHLPVTSHDFGQVSEEQELVNTFVLENRGIARPI